MTSKFEDAIAVLGEENKALVDEIEMELAKEGINKSQVADLIMRSINEVEKTEIIDSKYQKLVSEWESLDKSVLVKVLHKLLDDGEITEDGLSNLLSQMAGNMTSQSTVEQTKEEIKSIHDEPHLPGEDMTESKPDEEKMKDGHMMNDKHEDMPKDEDHSDNDKDKDKKDEDNEVEKIMNAVNSLSEKVDSVITRLNALDQTRTASEVPKATVDVIDQPDQIKSLVNDLEQKIRTAVTKSGNERMAEMQTIIEGIGGEFLNLHNSLVSTENINQPINVQTEDIKSVVENVVKSAVDQRMNLVEGQIRELSNLLQNVLTTKTGIASKTPPVQKSIVNIPVQPRQNMAQALGVGNKPLSIADIARRTVFR